ncbi:MAG: hypothetical protein J6Y37_09890 [Paludibacteraceae bacterium]|nr:hypothetical protein [Paludibacteraceae bacterium]
MDGEYIELEQFTGLDNIIDCCGSPNFCLVTFDVDDFERGQKYLCKWIDDDAVTFAYYPCDIYGNVKLYVSMNQGATTHFELAKQAAMDVCWNALNKVDKKTLRDIAIAISGMKPCVKGRLWTNRHIISLYYDVDDFGRLCNELGIDPEKYMYIKDSTAMLLSDYIETGGNDSKKEWIPDRMEILDQLPMPIVKVLSKYNHMENSSNMAFNRQKEKSGWSTMAQRNATIYQEQIDPITDVKRVIMECFRELMTEGAESRNMKAAKHYLYDNYHFDEKTAMGVIGNVKRDIPNSRLAKCKFMMGVVRMFMEGELSDGKVIMALNKTLRFVCSDAHVNEYDNNLNGISADELVTRFSGLSSQELEKDKQELSSVTYSEDGKYDIVKIDNFDKANEYSNYVTWCITSDPSMYDSYTNDGEGIFYFCLKEGFENVPREAGPNAPLDDYGLSMIAVSVNPDGSCNTITCRWNHDKNGNDSVLTTKELSSIIGRNFYDTFKPLSQSEILKRKMDAFNALHQKLVEEVDGVFFEEFPPDDNSSDKRTVMSMYGFNDEKQLLVFDDEEYTPVIKELFEGVYNRCGDVVRVFKNGMKNLVRLNGTLFFKEWYNEIQFLYSINMIVVRDKPIDSNPRYTFYNIDDGKMVGDRSFTSIYNNRTMMRLPFGCCYFVRDGDRCNFLNLSTGKYAFKEEWPMDMSYLHNLWFITLADGKIIFANTENLVRYPYEATDLIGRSYDVDGKTFQRVVMDDGKAYSIDTSNGDLYDDANRLVYSSTD